MRISSSLRSVLAVGFFLLMPLGASGLTIDDFENGDFSRTDTTTSNTERESQGGLTGVLGSVRESLISLASGTSATISVGGGAGTASATTGSFAFFQFQYDGAANGQVNEGVLAEDLTLGGDRFVLEVTAVSSSVEVFVAVSDSAHVTGGVIPSNVATVASPGTYEFPFSSFSGSYVPDFTDIDLILFRSNGNTALGSGASISFGSFSVVPEPTTALLFATCLGGLAVWRRRLH